MKMKSFLILQVTIIASTVPQLVTALAQIFFPVPLPDSDLISVVTSSIQTLLLNFVNDKFLHALSTRPYVSGRVSSVYGDPLNDAESLRIRAISLGYNIMSVRTWWGKDKVPWLVNVFCGFWVAFLAFTTTKMFSGEFKSLRERMSTKRRRANSAYSTDEGGDIFEEMNHEDDVVKKMKLRGKMHCIYEGSTHEGEKRRWLVAEVEEKSTWLNIGCRSIKETLLGCLGSLLILVANVIVPSSPLATIVLQNLSLLSYIRLEWNYSFKALREMVGRWRERGDTGEGAAEQPTDGADVEVELRQNPLHIDDKDVRKSGKSERDSVKSKKDEKIMESFAQYMNPGVKNANAKNGPISEMRRKKRVV